MSLVVIWVVLEISSGHFFREVYQAFKLDMEYVHEVMILENLVKEERHCCPRCFRIDN
jgi:hypothetical protein